MHAINTSAWNEISKILNKNLQYICLKHYCFIAFHTLFSACDFDEFLVVYIVLWCLVNLMFLKLGIWQKNHKILKYCKIKNKIKKKKKNTRNIEHFSMNHALNAKIHKTLFVSYQAYNNRPCLNCFYKMILMYKCKYIPKGPWSPSPSHKDTPPNTKVWYLIKCVQSGCLQLQSAMTLCDSTSSKWTR